MKHANGHIRKDQLTGMSWKPYGVEVTIRSLSTPEQRAQGYRGWVEAHRQFLASGETHHRLLPSRLQQHFVEAALWPWLHCHDAWCESSLKAFATWSRPFTSTAPPS